MDLTLILCYDWVTANLAAYTFALDLVMLPWLTIVGLTGGPAIITGL